MTWNAAKNIILVQITSLVGIIFCVILKPHGLVANAGLSYFGNFKRTIIPYGVVLLGGSWFFHQAAGSLPKKEYDVTRTAFTIFSILYVVLFFTPYSLNNFVDWLHTLTGIVLFSSEVLLTAWLTIRTNFNSVLCITWLCMFLAGVLCAIYTPPPKGYLLESQIIFQIFFTLFYVKYLSLDHKVHKSSEKALSIFAQAH